MTRVEKKIQVLGNCLCGGTDAARRSFGSVLPPFARSLSPQRASIVEIAISCNQNESHWRPVEASAREKTAHRTPTKREKKTRLNAAAPVFATEPCPSPSLFYLSLILFRRRCSASWCLDAYVVDIRDSPDRVRPPAVVPPAPAPAPPPAVNGAAGADAAGCRCCSNSVGGGIAAAAAPCCTAILFALPWGPASWASCANRAISSGARAGAGTEEEGAFSLDGAAVVVVVTGAAAGRVNALVRPAERTAAAAAASSCSAILFQKSTLKSERKTEKRPPPRFPLSFKRKKKSRARSRGGRQRRENKIFTCEPL